MVAGIIVGVIVIGVSASQLDNSQPVAGLGITGGQAARIAVTCAVIGIILLARNARG
jgi:hypothetical protein